MTSAVYALWPANKHWLAGPEGLAMPDVSLPVELPTIEAVRGYLGPIADNKADADLQGALVAEQSAQAAVCRTNPFTADLAEALRRRVACNLARRALPLAIQSDADGGGTYIGSNDPEVRRLERPYRKLVVG